MQSAVNGAVSGPVHGLRQTQSVTRQHLDVGTKTCAHSYSKLHHGPALQASCPLQTRQVAHPAFRTAAQNSAGPFAARVSRPPTSCGACNSHTSAANRLFVSSAAHPLFVRAAAPGLGRMPPPSLSQPLAPTRVAAPMPLALRVHMQQQHQRPSSAACRSPPPPPLEADLHTREFHVLLDADAAIDETKLRRAALSGVPPHMRQRVWKLLLGVSSFDTADDLALNLNRTHSYNAFSADIDHDDYVPSRIRRVLKRSRTAYQPLSSHDRRVRYGSSSGESYDGDDDDDGSIDVHRPSTPLSSARNLSLSSSSYSKATQRKRHHVVDRQIQSKFTRVITTYLKTAPHDVQFHDDMVYLCAPFIEIMPTEADAFHAFTALMRTCQHLYTERGLKEAVADFNLMFRGMHPNLYDKFVVEEVDMNRFVCRWLRGLLVHQLPRRCLLRLWDSYFANLAKDALNLHPFVCLVFIELLDQELEECDDAERILSVLEKIPATDVDHVIAHAHTARERLREKGIV
eukprot:TRINITY_DN534_c1_g1_i11.p1 TRINITY_DN534_c1_g1~~TRINITY_DN534_c1_g1_i11.p1  ORF type:complete len:515 (+),score=82.29 TRINITY_DN534_c1_g1_i11:2888-4432(+)